MTITPEQFQSLVDAINNLARAVLAINGTIGVLGFLFLLFKKMG